MHNKYVDNWGEIFLSLIKWLIVSVAIGVIIGGIACGFFYAMEIATEFRIEHGLIMLGLPLSGLLIVWLYRYTGQGENTGTNRILTTIRNEDNSVPGRVAPLILVSTVITHLFGGSAGREGAALQFSAGLADWFARFFHLDESDRKIVILACMSAAFSALFGTPLTAAIFSLEVVSVGIMYYAALVPCLMSAFMAHNIAVMLGVQKLTRPYSVLAIPEFYSLAWTRVIILAIICALAGAFFCWCLHKSGHKLKKWMPNPYVRIFVCGCIIVGLRFLLRTDAFIGLGERTIHQSFVAPAIWWFFLVKILFTCLTLSSGFKGGEIVPSLFIGATLGSALSALLHLPADLAAACGMVCVFCSVTNSPIASMFMAFELFGFDGMRFYTASVAVGYLVSGYYSLYSEQKIMYSKTKNKYINRHTD